MMSANEIPNIVISGINIFPLLDPSNKNTEHEINTFPTYSHEVLVVPGLQLR